MTASILEYRHPIITAYQQAYEGYWGTKAPRVTRRTNKGYVIHGENGDSRIMSEFHIRRITSALRNWTRDGVGAKG
jgi:hypothetical protein